MHKHSGAPIPFEESQILEYYKKFLAQYSDYEDEDSEEGEKGKKNEPGIVKRPPEAAPLEGEHECKMARTAPPQGGEHNS
ncbi:hypothetical protein OsI_36366 [Oryza sativa Indica Group]|uniref:Uncharacterized protein n=1 Tax=Oryza sativa subsp. indica TaxID=39946 RepID=B8BKW1_ORYSI|nr:hypothetical protein OsI_36366 [Oryza sativa Indica Group]